MALRWRPNNAVRFDHALDAWQMIAERPHLAWHPWGSLTIAANVTRKAFTNEAMPERLGRKVTTERERIDKQADADRPERIETDNRAVRVKCPKLSSARVPTDFRQPLPIHRRSMADFLVTATRQKERPKAIRAGPWIHARKPVWPESLNRSAA